jgi:release factor glutamine methyltransferase
MPHLDSAVLLCSALGCKKEELYTEADKEVPLCRLLRFSEMLKRRTGGEPVQYIKRSREFMSLAFKVSPAVLIPRPETELLVEKALDLCRARLRGCCALTLLDIGTGSGAIAVSLAVWLKREFQHIDLHVIATDVSEKALAVAAENARAHGVTHVIEFLCGDTWEPLDMSVDAVVSNPPYIKSSELTQLSGEVRLHEPLLALDGGHDGLCHYRKILGGIREHLRPDGFVAFEVGMGQAKQVHRLLLDAGFDEAGVERDLQHIERVVWAQSLRGDG